MSICATGDISTEVLHAKLRASNTRVRDDVVYAKVARVRVH